MGRGLHPETVGVPGLAPDPWALGIGKGQLKGRGRGGRGGAVGRGAGTPNPGLSGARAEAVHSAPEEPRWPGGTEGLSPTEQDLPPGRAFRAAARGRASPPAPPISTRRRPGLRRREGPSTFRGPWTPSF